MGGTTSIEQNVGKIVSEPTEGHSAIHRHHDFPDRLVDVPFLDKPEIDTPYKVFENTVRLYPKNNSLGERKLLADGKRGEYVFDTYEVTNEKVAALGSAMAHLGLKHESPVGIFSINRVEWVEVLFALWRQGCTCVPLYDTLGSAAVDFILKDANVTTVFVAQDKMKNLLAAIGSGSVVTTIVQFEAVTEEAKKTCSEKGITLVSYQDFMQSGKDNHHEATPSPADSLAYIMYTSGTTGNPKGVLLSNKNILASVSGLRAFGVDIVQTDVYFSYLPLAHSFETVMQLLGLCAGAACGFYQGSVKLLTDDIVTLKPTVFAGVPRVYSRIHDKVRQVISEKSFLVQKLFATAYENQLDNVRQGTRNGMWDTLVFDKAKQALGGRVRLMATGAAPMPAHLHEFLKVVFGCPVMQGYGMTENAAAAVATPANYVSCGTVGVPLPCTEVRLEDVPEMNYTSKDSPNPRGEICLRGPNVFRGYHNAADKTAEALDAEGWLHTGDIGQFLPDGSLQVIDRKKNIFKLAQGEYVAAEELENIFLKSRFCGQLWIYGNSFYVSLIAVIVPNFENLRPWCRENGLPDEPAEAAAHPKVKEMIMKDIERLAKADQVAGFKIPKDIIIEGNVNELGQGFTVENDCLTPTFKLRRPQLQAKYQEQINAMYAKLEPDAQK